MIIKSCIAYIEMPVDHESIMENINQAIGGQTGEK
jgi:hypothetical protein